LRVTLASGHGSDGPNGTEDRTDDVV